MMLGTSKLVGFVATAKPDEARRFYELSLGLRLLEDSPYALVFASGNSTIRVQKVQSIDTPPYTSLGWAVEDIAVIVEHLVTRGVVFQRYEGLAQDEMGIWHTPGGARVAWFKDPDGNTLSLTEYAAT